MEAKIGFLINVADPTGQPLRKKIKLDSYFTSYLSINYTLI